MLKIVITVLQLIVLLSFRIVYFGRVKVKALKEDDYKRPTVIVANHSNKLDPFIVACFLPIMSVLRVMPYRFMTANNYYYRWYRPFAFLAGLYPAHKISDSQDPNTYGIGKSLLSIDQGYSIVMFPEGRRVKKTGQIVEAKYGISRILEKSKITPVLCFIRWHKGLFPTGRRVQINITLADSSLNTNEPNKIMNQIYALSDEHTAALEVKKA